MEKPLKIDGLILISLCALCSGPSYLFIKIAIAAIPPITLVFCRLTLAFLSLFIICCFQKQRLLEWKHRWKEFFILGIFFNAFPNILICYGEYYISSSLTGILNSFTLIFTAILSHYFGSNEPMGKNQLLGILAGVVGLVVIYLPMLFQEGGCHGIGVLLLIVSTLSYGVGTVYARSRMQKNVPFLVMLTAQLAIAALLTIPFSLYIDHPFSLPMPPPMAIMSTIGLGLIGTAASYYLYYKAIHLSGATYGSFSVLLVPIFAMILGALILNEQLTWNLYLGAAFILAGVLAVNPVTKHRRVASTFNK